ncbi:MAG: hypothetical protein MMC33_001712 [Icmadophila ericetorum]|nr:hypothetical protein [Icmadophila ericetorum]
MRLNVPAIVYGLLLITGNAQITAFDDSSKCSIIERIKVTAAAGCIAAGIASDEPEISEECVGGAVEGLAKTDL